jgi:hypothetical protein
MPSGRVTRHIGRRCDERGRPVVSYRWMTDGQLGPSGERRQVQRAGFPTREAAQRSMRQFQSELENGDYLPPSEITVARAVDSWLLARRNVEPSTVRGYRIALSHLTAALGNRLLQSVTRPDIERLVVDMVDRRSPRTVALTLGCTKRMFRDACREGVLTRNPAEYVAPPASRRKESKIWTRPRSELSQMLPVGTGSLPRGTSHLRVAPVRGAGRPLARHRR